MIINNSELIKNLLWFPTSDQLDTLYKCKGEVRNQEYFYVVQLIQRAKDNPTKSFGNPNHRNNSNRSLYQTHIYSISDFEEKLPLIIELANVFQARAYINLNLKSSYKAFINLVKNIGCRLETSNYSKMNRIYNEAIGEVKGAVIFNDRWIVDIDDKSLNIVDIINEIQELRGGGNDGFGKGKVYETIPTKNGYHLITSSFDLNSYREWERLNITNPVDVHKDNPTILWMNTDWSKGN